MEKEDFICRASDNRLLAKFFGLNGYVCTEVPYHKGDHISGGDTIKVLYTWEHAPKGLNKYLFGNNITPTIYFVYSCYLIGMLLVIYLFIRSLG